jgi:hypothetical protein
MQSTADTIANFEKQQAEELRIAEDCHTLHQVY